MNNTYYSGIPYSESLQHYGVPGMKWGVRRYQNKDGTRTSLGKKRYRKGGELYRSSDDKNDTPKGAVKNAPRRLAEGIVRGVKQKLAEKMPYFLNDEELQKYTDRQRAENIYLNARADKRQAKQRGKQESYGVTLLKSAANKAVGIAVDKTVNKAMDRALETSDERALRELNTKNKVYETRNKAMNNRVSAQLAEDESNIINETRQIKTNNQRARDLTDKIRKSKEYDPRKAAYKLELKNIKRNTAKITKDLNDREERLEETRNKLRKQGHTTYPNNSNQKQNKTFKMKNPRKKH